MNKIIFFLILCLTTQAAQAENLSVVERFKTASDKHREEIRREGMEYVVGGAIGLGTSLTLGIESREAFPKIGYSFLQLLSSAALAYGATLYSIGDSYAQEAIRIEQLESTLKSENIGAKERDKILTEEIRKTILREKERRKKERQIRGWLEITSAASASATMAFSKAQGTSSDIALGFISIVSLAGGLSDLLGSDEPKTMTELFSLDGNLMPNGGRLALSFRW